MSRSPTFLRKLWPRRLLGQTIVLLLIALLSAQIVSALIIRGETRSFFRGAELRFMAERISPIIKLMRDTPEGLRPGIADAVSSQRAAFWLSQVAAVGPFDIPRGKYEDDDRHRAHELADRIAGELGETLGDGVRVHMRRDHHDDEHEDIYEGGHHGGSKLADGMASAPSMAPEAGIIISVRLTDGQWLNAAVRARPPRRLLGPESWITFFVAAIAISVIVVIALSRITRPLSRLSAAAEKLGRGERVAALKEEGPEDVRDAIHAFNDMQDRLRKFVADRTRMLAAISHDMRTPITSLRLRAEMIEDDETRERMIATLEEMQKMTEATLAFVRAESADEETRATDIAALLNSVTDDLADMGQNVTLEAPQRVIYRCRPGALTRALRNLIENAVRYGDCARVVLSGTPATGIRIDIDDDGPGITAEERERVFEPFVRLEGSRSTETGGIGLGMAIARDIVHHHGGSIGLENRPEGGLRVSVKLPANPT